MNTTTAQGFDLSLIDPKNHERYSPNLFAFLRTRRQRRTVEHGVFARDTQGREYLGYMHDGELIGAMLGQVLTRGNRAKTFCWVQRMTIIDGMVEEYHRIGRCAFDRDHRMGFLHSDGRYIGAADHRKCTWCGAEFRMVRTPRTVIDEKWELTPGISEG